MMTYAALNKDFTKGNGRVAVHHPPLEGEEGRKFQNPSSKFQLKSNRGVTGQCS
jgi:hypothetical protein